MPVPPAPDSLPLVLDRSTAPDFRSGAWKAGVATTAEELRPIHPTLVHAFAAAARLGADVGVTLVHEDAHDTEEQRSFSTLYGETKRIACGLLDAGVGVGDRVLVVLPTSFEFITVFFAIERIGAIPVPSYPPAVLDKVETALDRLRHIANHCEAAACVTSSSLLAILGDLGLSVPTMRTMLAAEKLVKTPDRGAEAHPVRPDDPAFIQYTSGSTGNPKGVVLTHRNVTSNIHAIGQAFQINRTDVGVSWLPLYHDMGLIGGLLTPLYWRVPIVLLSPIAFLMKPARWLWAIHRHRGTLAPAPNFAYALCVRRVRPKAREGLDLSSWRVALNGAEPVSSKILEAFETTYAPHGFKREAMYPVYGLAEASLAVTFPRPGDPPRVDVVDRTSLAVGSDVRPGEGASATALVCVGRVLPGHELRVADDQGHAVPESRVGHILVRGPSVMAGYYQDREVTDRALRRDWLWTGDLGFIRGGGLFVTGRAKDIVIVRGRNHYAEDIERVAETVSDVRAGGSVAFSIYDEERAAERAVLVCETTVVEEKERARIKDGVIDAVSAACGLIVDDVALVTPGTLPKTSSGKRQRSLTRELYVNDELHNRRTGKLKLALVVARSGIGLLELLRRRLTSRPPTSRPRKTRKT